MIKSLQLHLRCFGFRRQVRFIKYFKGKCGSGIPAATIAAEMPLPHIDMAKKLIRDAIAHPPIPF